MKKTFPPEFSALMAQYRDTTAGLGDGHPITRRLWLPVEATAPDGFRDEMMDMARSMGLLPTARMCNDQGKQMFTSAELAMALGITNDEAETTIHQLVANRKALGLPSEGLTQSSDDNLHRLH